MVQTPSEQKHDTVHMAKWKKSTTSRESGAFFISSMTRNFAVCEICRALNPPVPAKLNPSSLSPIQVTRTL